MVRPRNSLLTEWEAMLMNVIWENEGISANDIMDALKAQNVNRHNSSIRTTLSFMEKKGYISHRAEGRSYYYSSKFSRRDVEKSALEYVRDVFFFGSSFHMIFRLMEKDHVSFADLKKRKKKMDSGKNERHP